MYGFVVALHAVAATIWTGGHLVLALSVLPQVLREKDVAFISRFESGYERIGIPALIVQVVTGFWLASTLLPDPRAWLDFTNPVARLVAVKVALLLATALLAADARLRVIPNLDESNLKSLAFHIAPVTIISVLFVIAGVSFRFGWLS